MILDISKHQGAIDWDALAPALDFVVIKASGKSTDPQFARNASEATRRGIPFHAYHFLYCTTEARAKNEARLFADSVGDYSPLFYVLDCEAAWGVSKRKARAVAEAFEAELRRLRGPDIRVAVYIGHNVYKDYALDYSRYAYVWIPRYGVNDGKPHTPPDYPCDLWQYASTGSAPGISGNVDVSTLTGSKPLDYFTGSTSTTDQSTPGGDTNTMDYSKYIISKSPHYISNSGSDEHKSYHGGTAGDQTGHEWELKAWYARPWSVVLRYPDAAVGLRIAQLACAAALNDRIGYDQWQRTTYWQQLQKAGYDPSKITVACEEDCTAGVTANVKAVGYLLGIPELSSLPIDTYSGNMRSRFVAAGFTALTASKYTGQSGYLLPGDILLYEGHHAATNISYGKYVRPSETPQTPAETAPEGLRRGDYGSAVKGMQQALKEWDGRLLPRYGCDGDFGGETEDAVKMFQGASGLPVTGIYDEATRKALAAALAASSGCDGDSCPVDGPEEPDEDTLGEISGPSQVTVTGGSVNVRSGPGTSGTRVLGVAHAGDRLPYQDQSRNVGGRKWYLVEFDGQNGWISSKYSRLE